MPGLFGGGRACAARSCRTFSLQPAVPGQQGRGCDGEDSDQRPVTRSCQRGEPGPAPPARTGPAGVSSQHRVLVPEHQHFSHCRWSLRNSTTIRRVLASQYVEDLEQHPPPNITMSSLSRQCRSTCKRVFEAQDPGKEPVGAALMAVCSPAGDVAAGPWPISSSCRRCRAWWLRAGRLMACSRAACPAARSRSGRGPGGCRPPAAGGQLVAHGGDVTVV